MVARPGVAPFFRLTDEELHLLGAADDVETPYLDRLEPEQRAVAVDVAYRSLLAHGMCEAKDGGLLVPEELVQLLQVRAGPDRAYRVEVRSRDERTIRHLYQAGGTTVCEDVSLDGMHDFDVRPTGEAHALLTELLALGPDRALETGARTTWRATGELDPAGEPAPWGAVCATADLRLRQTGVPDERASVVWGAAGNYLISEVAGSSRSPSDGDACTLAEMVADHLGIRQASCLSRADQQVDGVKVRSVSPM